MFKLIFFSKKATLAFLVLLSIYICFYKLGHSYLENWDEGFYAQVTKEMLERKDFITLYWNNKIFLDKPPLNFWINAFFVKIFGFNEFSIRITSAISGFIATLILIYISNKNFGLIPTLYSFSAVALNNLYIWRVRTGNLDSLLTLLFFLSYLTIINQKIKYRYKVLGFLFGLIYLQKLNIVFLPIIIFILFELITKKTEVRKHLFNYLIVLLIFVIISGGWLFLGWLKNGDKFLQYYLFMGDQGVSHIKLSFFKTDYISYLYYSLQRRLIYPFIIGSIFLIINIKKQENVVLLFFSMALLIFLSFTERKNNWYLVPSIPFWGLTIGYGMYNLLELVKKIRVKTVKTDFLLSIILVIPLIYISYKTLVVNINSIINMESSVWEVKTAKKVKEISQKNDKILRLDYAYPVTLFYSGRETYYYVELDKKLFDLIEEKKIKYLLGKKEVVDTFVKYPQNKFSYEIIPVNDERIVKILN